MLLNLMNKDKYMNLPAAAFIAFAIGDSLRANIMLKNSPLAVD